MSQLLRRIAVVVAASTLAVACAPVTRTVFEGETVVPLDTPKPPVSAAVHAGPPADVAPPRRVVVHGDRIQISEKIQFDPNRSTIRSESDALLDEIAHVVTA